MERRELEDRLRALELKAAQADGVLDVLRGRGVPGALAIRGTYDPSIEYSTLIAEVTPRVSTVS
jgi:hypothetical protein